MAGASARTADLSREGLLAWEARERRFERVAGVVRAMAGGPRAHDTVAGNLRVAWHAALRARGCEHFGSDVKVVSPRGEVMDPQLTVRCGPANGRLTAVDDPLVAAEVRSQGTAQHDLIRKRLACGTVPSLRPILHLAHDRPRVDRVRRGPDRRRDDGEPAVGIDAVLELPELGCAIPLAPVYEGVELADRGALEAGEG